MATYIHVINLNALVNSVLQIENRFHYLDLHSIESSKPNKVSTDHTL